MLYEELTMLKENKLNIALTVIKDELSILRYAGRYKISNKEAREFKKWCHEIYYYKTYKTPEHNFL